MSVHTAPRLRETARRILTAPVLVLAVVLGGCRETAGGNGLAPTPSPQQTVQLRVERALPGDSVMTVTLRISVRDPAGQEPSMRERSDAATRVASVTAAIFYDTTRLHFVQDASPTDGAMRASHARDGRVVMAAAHALGFEDDAVARVTFVTRDSAAYETLRLQVSELHLLDASDVRPLVTVLPVEVVR